MNPSTTNSNLFNTSNNALNPTAFGTNNPNATYTPPSVPQVDVNQLQNTQQITPATRSTPPDYTQTIQMGNQLAQNYVNSLSQNQQTLNAQQSPVTQRLNQLYGELPGKTTYQNGLYNQYGVPGQLQDINNLNSQIAMTSADFLNQSAQLKLAPTTQGIVSAQTQVLQQQAAAKTMGLQAILTAKQGNVALANDLIQRAVDAKYQPIQDEITARQAQLQNNYDLFDKNQKTLADQQLAVLNQYGNQLDQAKMNYSAVQNIALQAASSGVPANIATDIASAATPAEAIAKSQGSLSFQTMLKLYQQGFDVPVPTYPADHAQSGQPIATPAVLNNNPGNIKDPQTGTFKQFSTPQQGFSALKTDLLGKMTGATSTGLTGNSTLLDFANVWAPQSDNNNPTLYAQNLAAQLGVKPNAKIGQFTDPEKLNAFALAVSKNEDINMYNTLTGKQNPVQTPSPEKTTAVQQFSSWKSSLPTQLQQAAHFVQSTGAKYLINDPSLIPSDWAPALNRIAAQQGIPVLNKEDADVIKGADEALQNIETNIEPAWKDISPSNNLTKAGTKILMPFSTLGDTDFYSKAKAYQSNQEGVAQQVATLAKSAPRAGLISIAENAIPTIAGYFNPFAGVDTYKDGINKINKTKQLLSNTITNLLPGSPQATQTNPNGTPSQVQYQGKTYNVDASGNMTEAQ